MKSRLFAGVVVVFIAMAIATGALAYQWFSYGGHQYTLTDNLGTWQDCENEAVAAGGHLASINDEGENAWLAQLIWDNDGWTRNGQHNIAWIGLYYVGGTRTSASSWRWVSGDPVTLWKPYPPGLFPEGEHMYLLGNRPGSQAPGYWDCNPLHETSFDQQPRGIIEVIPEPGAISLLMVSGLAFLRRKHS